MPTIAELLEQAVEEHGAGRWPLAEQLYRQVLEKNPDEPDALHMLGVLAFQTNQPALAVEWITKAIRADPSRANFHHNLGVACQALNDPEQAITLFRRAVELEPAYVEAHNNLAIALRNQGRFQETADCYRRLAELVPESPEVHGNLGVMLRAIGDLDGAVAAHRRALELEPDLAATHNNLANALLEQQKWPEAESHFLRATELKPNYTDALANLAAAYWEQGDLAQASTFFDRTLAVVPDHAEAHLQQSMIRLLEGRFELGWNEYEWRWKTSRVQGYDARKFVEPLWDGSPLAGRRILLRAEQGLGDTLQFVRYAPLVKQRGGTVIVECQPEVAGVLKSCAGIDVLAVRGEPLPSFDTQAPLLSLPLIFGTNLDTIPSGVPYLFAAADLVEKWRETFADRQVFKIGITWRGSPHNRRDRTRSLPLACFAPLAQRPGVRLYSLQKGLAHDALATAEFAITDLADQLHDFADTAAVMMHLDLMITCDSAPAHLAGALGRPIWVPLPTVPDWRWLLVREDSPWYPTMRLFRQRTDGDWPGVFAEILAALGCVYG